MKNLKDCDKVMFLSKTKHGIKKIDCVSALKYDIEKYFDDNTLQAIFDYKNDKYIIRYNEKTGIIESIDMFYFNKACYFDNKIYKKDLQIAKQIKGNIVKNKVFC